MSSTCFATNENTGGIIAGSLHPNATGAGVIAQIVYDAIQGAGGGGGGGAVPVFHHHYRQMTAG